MLTQEDGWRNDWKGGDSWSLSQTAAFTTNGSRPQSRCWSVIIRLDRLVKTSVTFARLGSPTYLPPVDPAS